MRILWIATKPPWPILDGGRLLAAATLEALAAEGVEIVLVAPVDRAGPGRDRLAAELRRFGEPHLVPVSRVGLARAVLRARRHGLPISIDRHSFDAVRAEVEACLARTACDLVHAEQLQALPHATPARRRGLPVVLRAQNVESDLWAALAAARRLGGGLARREAARLARHEGAAVGSVAATIALTARDAERLRALAGPGAAVHHVGAPFAATLPPAPGALPGAPAVVVLAGGWLPNRDGAAWFVREIWPGVRARSPQAVLHLFGGDRRLGRTGATVVHPAPLDSEAAFPRGAILAVPLRIASGVRMKILEAWARGIAVVATPEAAAGLDATDGRELFLARDPESFAGAVSRLHADPARAAASVEAGRALLRQRHDPGRIARRLAEIYATLAGPGSRRPA